jgi:hypothetical protein
MISLLVISRIIFYRKHFWAPGSNLMGWRDYIKDWRFGRILGNWEGLLQMKINNLLDQ